MAMLEVKDLSVYYGVIQALKGISFEVEEGDVIASSEPTEPERDNPSCAYRPDSGEIGKYCI